MPTLSSGPMRLRVENEYKAMCKLPIVSFYSWKLGPGQKPPYVRSYEVTYKNPYMIKKGGFVTTAPQIMVRFDLPDNYPSSPPNVTIIKGEIPYLPNVYTSGRFCFGNLYNKGTNMWLWEFINMIGRVLAGDPLYTHPGSAANSKAAYYYNNHRNKYPTGRIDFPRPS